jgi:type IV secretory pathway VirB10-like protein
MRRAVCFQRMWHDDPTMGFLKRLFGGNSEAEGDVPPAPPAPPAIPTDVEADERAHELDLARSEQDRLSDLQQRQLKYADYAWQPPAQGGTRRADDEDAAKEDA